MAAAGFSSRRGVAGVKSARGLFFIFTLVCLTSSLTDKDQLENLKEKLQKSQQKINSLKADWTTNSELISKYKSIVDPAMALLKKTSEASPDFAPLEGLLENIKGLIEETSKKNEEFGVATEIAEQELEKLKKLFTDLEEQQAEL